MTQAPDEAVFNAVEGIADTVIEEGTDVLGQHLDGPPGSLSRDLRKAGLKAQDIYRMTEDEAFIGRLTDSPGLRRVLMKLVREALVSAGDDMDTFEAEGGEDEED